MSQQESILSDNGSTFDLLADREKELEDLLTQMDQLQSEVDGYTQKLNDITLEIEKSKQEYKRYKIINQTVSIGPSLMKVRQIDDDAFTGEHYELIKNKRDEIAHLTEQINDLQAKTQPIDDLVTDLQRQNAILLCEKSNTKIQLQKTIAEKKRLDQDCQNTREHIKELDISIANQSRVAKDVETVVGGLINRRDTIMSQTDPNSELQHKITALRVQKQLLEDENMKKDDYIHNFEDDMNDIIKDIDDQIKTTGTKINWDRERIKLQTELDTIQKQLKQTLAEISKCNDENQAAERRMHRLIPIVQKRGRKFIGKKIESDDDLENVSIDKLLAQCRNKENKVTKQSNTDLQKLGELLKENQALENEIEHMKSDLTMAISRFSLEKTRIKSEIRENRTRAFEDEHQTVEQIKKLKIKSAKVAPKK